MENIDVDSFTEELEEDLEFGSVSISLNVDLWLKIMSPNS